MKVLHCFNRPKIGGIENLVIDLAIQQKSIGLDVALMLHSLEGQLIDKIRKSDIPVFVIVDSYNPLIIMSNIFNMLKLFRQYDVVHVHNFALLRSLILTFSVTRVVYTVHGLSKGQRKSTIKNRVRELFKSHFTRRCNSIIANSEYTKSMLAEHYGIEKADIAVVFNGVVSTKESNPKHHQQDVFKVGTVSRFVKSKRLEKLVNGYYLFLKEGGVGELWLIGDGPTRGEIENLVNSLGLSSSVRFFGYQTDVNRFYSEFNVCVYPFYGEGFGLVAVEAYLHGKSVIVFSDSGGMSEVVRGIEPENVVMDVNELKSRLLTIQNEYSSIKDLENRRKTYALNHYSMSRMVNNYLSIYKLHSK